MAESIVVSCPGKVLAAGGYVVLEKPNAGLVVATASRFYATASELQSEQPATSQPGLLHIRAESPQFTEASWDHLLQWHTQSETWSIATPEGQSRNPFVQNAVHAAVLFLSGLALSCPPSSDTSSATDATQFPFTTSSCKVIILGDNDFYTQSSLHPPPFASFNHPISQVHKTGLGSSAAMTTSLVGALLHFLCPAHLLSKIDRHALHNVAQFAHAAAQGKVGSGFDVSSAVFGTHQYTRFDPQLLKELLDRPLDEIPAKQVTASLLPSLRPSWSDASAGPVVHPLALPPLTTLLLADVDAGSNTPSMVSSVLKWRKGNPEQAAPIWNGLVETNQRLAEVFRELNRLWEEDKQEYIRQVAAATTQPVHEWPASGAVGQSLVSASEHMQAVRRNMKAMGVASNVGIEPNTQTKLLDACCTLPGIIGAGVPGAGGLDAIFVLALTTPEDCSAITSVERVWREWQDTKVTALSASSRSRGSGLVDAASQAVLPEGIQIQPLREAEESVRKCAGQ